MKYLTRSISILFLIITLFACQKSTKQEKIILDRIEYIYNLKSQIDKNIWPDFSNQNFDLPLIYYTDSTCYVTNPTDKFVPDVKSTEMWATMVMHEYFHGFQFKHSQFLDYYEKNVKVSADTLKVLYQKYNWFKNSVDKENNLMLKALNSGSQSEIHQSWTLPHSLQDLLTIDFT